MNQRTTLTYSVPTISCAHCVKAITDEVAGIDGVTGVEVDLATKTVTVTVAVGGPGDDAIRAALDEAGYPPSA